MARIHPSDIPRAARAEAHNPELETLDLLRRKLPGDYTVFHGVHWTREWENRTAFGEIDFVIVNRGGEILVVEQKNGTLEISPDGPVKSYGGKRKNVDAQIQRSIDSIRTKFRSRHETGLKVDYLIYTPDWRLHDVNAAGLDASRFVDAASADGLTRRIDRLLGPGQDDGSGHAGRVIDFFRQTHELVPDISTRAAAHERNFVRLSGGLRDVVGNIDMTPFRLKVEGTAGCGKTLVACETYKTAIARGRRPLLVCFNRPLAESIARNVPEGGRVSTWWGLCSDFLHERGQEIDFDDRERDPAFWEKVHDRVISETVPEEWKFDTLIVDEGQDFEAAWLEILQLFLADEHRILWYEDRQQSIQKNRPVPLEGFVTYRARNNYRSPAQIAEFIKERLPFDFRIANALPGFPVGLHGYESEQEQEKLVARRITELVGEGFAPGDIAVLTCRGVGSSPFSAASTLGDQKIRRFTGDYGPDGSQLYTDGVLPFDTVRRFKGHEAQAVLLVDIDPREDRIEYWQKLLFCGMTRATLSLDLFFDRRNEALPRLLPVS